MIYEKATAEVILFDNSDVITASPVEGACNNGGGGGGGHNNSGCGNGSPKKIAFPVEEHLDSLLNSSLAGLKY